jgi:predicted ATP-dependent endonuclease of OLD family
MAQETLLITRVRIRNYRSIIDQEFSTNKMNLFVGLNDVGKSNILRALDLFFNGARAAHPYIFTRDFCRYTKTPKNKAKETSVTLHLKVPSSYDASEVVWRKAWRKDGEFVKGMIQRHVDGSSFKNRSRVPALLDAIRFEYVPAAKGNDYFESLLKALHDVLVDTVANDIRSASGGFTTTINDKVSMALKEIEARLGIKSTIQLPADLRELFSRLEFHSADELGVALGQRGDGIKARHIPILLHYIAQQARSRRIQGSPQTNIVWGFEEPENNLEMGMAAELAQEFLRYSSDIQLFVTTHSPAFYSLAATKDTVMAHKVSTVSDTLGTSIQSIPQHAVDDFDGHLGIMPDVIPTFKAALERRDEALALLKKSRLEDVPTLLVEGKTDKRVLEAAIELFNPKLKPVIRVLTAESAGTRWVSDMLLAWAYKRNSERVLGIVDADGPGHEAVKTVYDNQKVKRLLINASKKNEKKLTVTTLDEFVPPWVKEIEFKGFKVPLTLEEMFPPSVWQHASNMKWLEPRSDVIARHGFNDVGQTFTQHINESGLPADRIKYVLEKFKNSSKSTFVSHVCNLSASAKREAFDGFRPVIAGISKYFEQELRKGS